MAIFFNISYKDKKKQRYPMKKYNISLIGATGLVGREILNFLKDLTIELKLFASENSVGKKILFQNKELSIKSLKGFNFEDEDIVFFAAGSKISKEYIPQVLKNKKTIVIDSSSYFRMDKEVPLVIPEINAHALNNHQNLIASPNCTTTILLMALYPLHREFKIKRIIASTYQAASGGGKKLMDKLKKDTRDLLDDKSISNPYGFNLYLHDSSIQEDRYNQEEIKMENETRKILEDDKIRVSATCVRVPVLRAHSISINVEFEKRPDLDRAYSLLRDFKNVKIFENFSENRFATPLDAQNKIEVLISRLRYDRTSEKCLELWAVGDQLLKGAAWNAYQIAKELIDKKMVILK